jgi:hypothetical protein
MQSQINHNNKFTLHTLRYTWAPPGVPNLYLAKLVKSETPQFVCYTANNVCIPHSELVESEKTKSHVQLKLIATICMLYSRFIKCAENK